MAEKKLEEGKELSDKELIDQIQKRGYFVSKMPLTKDSRFKVDVARLKGSRYRFALVSDTHLCSRQQQLSYLHDFYSVVARRGIKLVLNAGDLGEGSGKMYRGQEYDLFVHGADAQAEYIIKNYPKRKGVETKVISGNHDLSYYKDAGVDLVSMVAKERGDIQYLGSLGAFVEIGGITAYLLHPTGGVAYARSYRLQKIIEQMAPEQKPHMLFSGHWHTPCHLPGYRNVEGVSLGCFQAQTSYLKAKGLYPFVAGLIVEIQVEEHDGYGLLSAKYEWIPYFRMKKDDY